MLPSVCIRSRLATTETIAINNMEFKFWDSVFVVFVANETVRLKLLPQVKL